MNWIPAFSARTTDGEPAFDTSMGFAHCAQNFARGGLSAPHDGHLNPNGAAHSMQNLALSGFSAPHFAQRIRLRSPKLEQ